MKQPGPLCSGLLGTGSGQDGLVGSWACGAPRWAQDLAWEGQCAWKSLWFLRLQAVHSHQPGMPQSAQDGIPERRSDYFLEGCPEILECFFLEEGRGIVGR